MQKYDHKIFRLFVLSTVVLSISACSFSSRQDSGPRHQVNVASIPDATPRVEPRSSGGNRASYTVLGKTYQVLDRAQGYVERGIASWYGTKFHGRKTANGEIYSMYKMTAAHRSLPIPTYVEVTNLKNGRRVIVRVNDRGPFHPNRIIDLSYVAAKKLGIAANGTGLVEVRAIDPRNWNKSQRATTNRPTLAGQFKNSERLFIQAGAFNSRDNASQLKKQLQGLFPDKNIILAKNKGDPLFRVQVGPLHSVDEADRVAQIMTDNGYPSPHVVID